MLDTSALPHLNAFLNGTSAMLLTIGYLLIRRGRINAHRLCMVSAIIVSALFLASYVTYHYSRPATPFAGQGLVRYVYFAILIPHTILAVIMLPFILFTIVRAFRGQYEKHKRIARWTLPIWLYVSVTGVIVYLMLYHLYPSR